jgi:hypothetical protein
VSLGSVTTSDLTVNGAFTSKGIDDNATSTAITIDASENVGIGNTSPSSKLDLYDSSTASDQVIASFIGNGTTGDNGSGFRVMTSGDNGNRHTRLYSNGSTQGLHTYEGSTGNRAVDTNFEISARSFSVQNGAGTTEYMRVDSTGNVGIGESSPSSRLTVREDNTSGETSIACYNPSADGDSAIWFGLASNRKAGIKAHRVSTGNDHDLAFYTNTNSSDAAEHMRIDSTGNVGIGQDNPSAPLTVDGPSNDTYVARFGNSAGGAGSIQGRTDIGLDFWATENGTHPAAAVGVEQVSTDQYRGGLLFSTRGTNSDVAPVERMRIDSSGNVGIGNTVPSSFSAQARQLVLGSTTSGATGLSVISSSAGTGNICFGDATSTSDSSRRGKITYEHSDNSMTFDTLSQERMRIDSSGNVGIGDTNPDSPLSIFNSGWAGINLTSSNANTAVGGRIEFNRDGETLGTNIAGTASGLSLTTGTAERMRIDSAGNVGIGTDSPGGKLSVRTTASASSDSHFGFGADNDIYLTYGDSGDCIFRTVNGAGTNAESMRIDSAGNVGIGESNPGANLDIKDATKATLRLNHTGSNSWDIANDSNLTFTRGTSEAMRIDSSGNLLVGTTAPIGAGASGVTVADISNAIGQVSIGKTYSGTTGAMKFYYGSTEVGRIDYSDTTTTYITSSDERLKENVVDAPAGKIDSIKVRSFDWKVDGEHQEYGFIAQELETVAPYAVAKGETDEDMWGVDYSKLVPMLVKEIQDLKAEVEALKNA